MKKTELNTDLMQNENAVKNAHAAFLQEDKDRPCRCLRSNDNHPERLGGSCGLLWHELDIPAERAQAFIK